MEGPVMGVDGWQHWGSAALYVPQTPPPARPPHRRAPERHAVKGHVPLCHHQLARPGHIVHSGGGVQQLKHLLHVNQTLLDLRVQARDSSPL